MARRASALEKRENAETREEWKLKTIQGPLLKKSILCFAFDCVTIRLHYKLFHFLCSMHYVPLSRSHSLSLSAVFSSASLQSMTGKEHVFSVPVHSFGSHTSADFPDDRLHDSVLT